LQTESEASFKLVTESQILSKMLDRVMNGTPKDIEQLSLGAISNSLSWIPSQIVEGLLKQGLLEFSQGVVSRFAEKGMSNRVPDKAAEICIDMMRDLVHLDDRVGSWVLDHVNDYVALAVACPSTFPAVTIKRSCARLVHALWSTK
jgi:hypothetical protein